MRLVPRQFLTDGEVLGNPGSRPSGRIAKPFATSQERSFATKSTQARASRFVATSGSLAAEADRYETFTLRLTVARSVLVMMHPRSAMSTSFSSKSLLSPAAETRNSTA